MAGKSVAGKDETGRDETGRGLTSRGETGRDEENRNNGFELTHRPEPSAAEILDAAAIFGRAESIEVSREAANREIPVPERPAKEDSRGVDLEVDAAGEGAAAENGEEKEEEKPKGGLKLLPEGERPRERLLKDGGGALTDAELLAVLLRTGCPGKTVVQISQEILDEHGGLAGLVWSDSRRLRRHGVGQAKSATVLAGIELARRLVRVQLPEQDLLDSPGAVSDYLLLRFGRLDQEVMGALFVDAKNQLLGETEIFRGTMTCASAEPRAILREAILCGASGAIVFHTHPSGDPAPSLHDLEFTKRMAKAGDLLGVRLLDHLILGGFGRWVSLRRRRAW